MLTPGNWPTYDRPGKPPLFQLKRRRPVLR
jgi:hypothetical protein